MKKTSDETYFNFPITFLRDAFNNIRQVMQEVMDYAGYVHTLKLESKTSENKMKAAGEFFGITYGNAKNSYNAGEDLFNSVPLKTPMVGINKTMLFDFYDNHKTPDEIAILLAFLAIKSILGNKPYIRMTNEFLLARMAGYVSTSEVPNPLPQPLGTYSTRRKLHNIKLELRINWNVNYYSWRTHGFYISIEKSFTFDKLVFEAEKTRKKVVEQELKIQQDEARKKAMQILLRQN